MFVLSVFYHNQQQQNSMQVNKKKNPIQYLWQIQEVRLFALDSEIPARWRKETESAITTEGTRNLGAPRNRGERRDKSLLTFRKHLLSSHTCPSGRGHNQQQLAQTMASESLQSKDLRNSRKKQKSPILFSHLLSNLHSLLTPYTRQVNQVKEMRLRALQARLKKSCTLRDNSHGAGKTVSTKSDVLNSNPVSTR